jgi:sirohydrochlorin ferrochelatase
MYPAPETIPCSPEPAMQHSENQGLPESNRDRTAILLIAHGSRQQSANDDLHELAARISAQGTYPIVEPCFLELAEPELKAGGRRCVELGATRVLMIPYFLSAGVHLRRDLTAARDELIRRHTHVQFILGPPLGPHPLLDNLVIARIGELDPAKPVNRRP